MDDKFELKQKIKTQTRQVNDDIEEKLGNIDFKEKLDRSRLFFKNADKEVYQKYKKLPKRPRRAFLIAVIVGASSYLAPKVVNDIRQKAETERQKKEWQKHQEDFKNKMTRRRVISDRADFDALYKDALGLIQLAMFPTECLVLTPYADNNKKVCNTIGLGSYLYPKDGDPKNSEWIKASQYFKIHGKQSISAEQALNLVDGWFCHRENGRVLNNMYKLLEGSALTAHEFAAIASVMYNNETKGRDLCRFVSQNYQNPMICAQKIADLNVKKGFGGLAKRHLHEAYSYLNLDDYISKINRFKQTSVTQLSQKDVAAGKAAIHSGNVEAIIKEQSKIVDYNADGSQSIREIIQSESLSPNQRVALMDFYNSTISFEKAKEEFQAKGKQKQAQAPDLIVAQKYKGR
ncbi:MAG: hypothetical protein J5895_04095 [Alphaproteobacteria bacterium]|nr:hypothetical protein [Alphaproteobacteria bacterium]